MGNGAVIPPSASAATIGAGTPRDAKEADSTEGEVTLVDKTLGAFRAYVMHARGGRCPGARPAQDGDFAGGQDRASQDMLEK
ncbi:hypothetical protein GCM10027068_04400 [Prescottella soli]